MGKRQYNQFCPMAYSLDVIGDRWTLLVIRELLFGYRRYKDFQLALPGLGTNLLATRLKELETAGIITHQQLPPPSASMVYQLTERGRALKQPMLDMARWGLPLLPMPIPEDDHINASAILTALELFFQPQDADEVSLSVEIHTQQEIFFAVIEDSNLAVGYGHTQQPDLLLCSDMITLLMLITGMMTVPMMCQNSQLRLTKGTSDHAEKFFSLFHYQGLTEAIQSSIP